MGLEKELMTTTEAAELWGVTMRCVQVLCDLGKVQGLVRMGRTLLAIMRRTSRQPDNITRIERKSRVKGLGGAMWILFL